MGEVQGQLKGMMFNRSIRVEARAERLSDSGGAVLIREALERTGVLRKLDRALTDPRDPRKITHPQSELLATFVTMLALGWQDQDDADTLRKDPLFRLAVSERGGDQPLRDDPAFADARNPPVPQGLASQPTLSRQLHRLAEPVALDVVREGLFAGAVNRLRGENHGQKLERLTLDFDGLPIAVAGHQPGSAYNGYCHDTVYHPLVATDAESGEIFDLQLRRGQAHAAEGATDIILENVARTRRDLAREVIVRMDAGMPSEELLGALEGQNVKYLARLRNNPVLDRMATPHLKRPVGRPPDEPRTWFHELRYAAKSWSCERRVVLVVQEHPGELLLHHFWLVTNFRASNIDSAHALERYRRRGLAEKNFGEFMDVLRPRLSSAPRGDRSIDWRSQLIGPVRPCDDPFFRSNQAILLLCGLAYNALNALRSVLFHAQGFDEQRWSMRRLRERVLRVAARVTLHARRVTIIVTEAAAHHWRLIWLHWHLLDAPAAAR